MAGGSGLDNQYVIDGVNITNMGYGALGSYSIVFGSLGNATPFDFVKEVQVKTGGYEAEFGQAIGGVINVVTKSGTNQFAGSAFGYTRPSGLENAWKQYQSVNGTVQTIGSSQSDAGIEVSGPLVKNKFFFFAAFDSQSSTRSLQAPDGFPLSSLGTVDRSRRNSSYSTKLTMQLTGKHRLEVSFFGDPSSGANGPQRQGALVFTDTSAFSKITFGGHNQSVRWDGILGPHWLVESTFARAANSISEVPSVDTWQVTDTTVTPFVFTGGVGFYEKGNTGVNLQWAIKSTHVLAAHEIRYGFEFDHVDYTQENQYTGPTFVTVDGRTTGTGAIIQVVPDTTFGRIYRVARATFSSARATTQHYESLFIQDTWRVMNRLTVSPGLRYEQETMSGNAIQNFTLKGNWAPRVGVAFTPTPLTKLFFNYGRFFARIPNDLAARSLSTEEDVLRADYFEAALTRPIPDGVTTTTPDGVAVTSHFLTSGSGGETIDPTAKLSYTDEFVVGFERELRPRLLVGVSYVYRNLGRVLEDVANVPVVAYDLGVPGLNGVQYILTNPSSATPIFPTAQFLGASFDNVKHRYDAVDVTMRRMGDRWSVLASYQWSRLRGNYEGFYRDDNGQSDPAITSLFDFPTNDPSFTAIGGTQFGYKGDIRYQGASGILPLDRPEQGKIFITYAFKNGLRLGTAVNLTSGKPLTPLAANPIYTNGGEIPTAPRGSGIMTVDGFKTRTPFLTTVDLQASYDLKVGHGRQVTLLLEAFNLLNANRTTDYDAWVELAFGVPNPDYGKPISQILSGPQLQAPRAVRIGARFKF